MIKKLVLKALEDSYAVCRLTSNDSIPEWAKAEEFLSITKTSEELSIVCPEISVPDDIKCEKHWRILKVEGPLDFSLIGILSSLSTTLAQNNISIFAVSTYDTDYILIKDTDFNTAIDVLENEGYVIV